TGPVVAGRIGSTTDAAYAVTGDTVNTASRLQSAAPSGEILIGDATYRLTQHAFAFAPREEISLKGKSEPVGVHRLLGPLAAGLLGDAYGVEHSDSVEVARSKLAAGLETLGVGAEDRAAMAAALARVFGLEQDDSRVRHLEPEQLKRQIFMAARALVERRLAAGPLVLVVEDLHWADAASIELLGAVADRLADRPLLVLLMYRPTLEPDPLGTSRTPHIAIEVTPLSRSGSEDLLAAWFGDSTHLFPERLRDLILERAGDNPLYLEEVVRALLSARVLVRDGLAWRCTADAATAQVPATLHGLLLARLDRLDAAERRIIQEAA